MTMTNQSKADDPRYWVKWEDAGAVGSYEDALERRVGKAYGFFDCDASLSDIGDELPKILRCVGTPAEVELSLAEMDQYQGDRGAASYARTHPRMAGRDSQYVLDATYRDHGNRETADEVAAVLNQAYQSPLFGKDEDEKFRGVIVYKDELSRVYKFRE